MAIVVMIVCGILWLAIQNHLAKNGIEPRTRGSLRYQRRKARKMGVAPEDVPIRPRSNFTPPPGRPWERDPNYVVEDEPPSGFPLWRVLFWVLMAGLLVSFCVPAKH